ncbi:hypothetical protein [Streptomyces sp. MI02-7b]|uniref:hypothetical protein n=1 Tax=Streptomyces sp. MI02-7b TaxID=462941 RepID=UPI0029B70050|nr:hypothetical protein [Streptomyces sp. MI02-7b]MDX3077039.1 hypothetical protein [Streptomyces sp. MI02-7b]
MPRPEESGGTEGAISAPWRATVLNHEQAIGHPPYERARSEGEPLARRDDLRVHGAVGEISCADASGRTRWTHRFSGRPNAAHISGGRVLVTTDSLEYTPWGLLGPALLLDLADGTLIAELRGERGAALRGGRFLLGLEGYSFFDTWEHDRDGDMVDSWRSYGHYVVGTGVRVVEADRAHPTRSRVVRLLPGGVIERGPHLTDPQAPRPLVLDDGTMLVLDGGVLRAVDRRLNGTVLAELLPAAPGRPPGRIGALRRDGDHITAVIAEPHPDRSPTQHTVHTWTIALHPRA